MRKTRFDAGRARLPLALGVLGLVGLGFVLTVSAQTASDIADTKHNLSVTGTGDARASTETRVCIFCHTPHNAAPESPLWNKELEPRVYTVYASPTLRAGLLPQPFGPTKLCLSCHDGTIAMGAVIDPTGGIAMSGGNTLPQGGLSNFGLDLSGHHPVSFDYHNALPNDELAASPPAELTYGDVDEIHCITCHDPHQDTYGKFLVKDNRYSALCTTCHEIAGWPGSAHATSPTLVSDTLLPRPPKTWPRYTTLGEWGCEACHTPHFAPTAEGLLNFTAGPEPFSCTTTGCHASAPGAPHTAGANRRTGDRAEGGGVDIGRQVRKISAHHEVPGQVATTLRRRSSSRSGFPGVGCADCHNPHVGTSQTAEAPYVSGLLRGVRGIDRNGGIVAAATYEYEVCFKCHADNSPDLEYVQRVVPGTNTRLAFAVENPSYHPVVGAGKALSVPSIPSSFEPSMNISQQIYCTACHADDEGGANGPHGSSFRPILRARYETADYTPESFDNYALCYRCHDQASILRDDSFKKSSLRTTPSGGGGHSGHLTAGIPCSACHDPHGVADNGAGGTGSHTHLINFDVRIVSPKPGSAAPVFNDTGMFSGTCTLVCHGVAHDNAAYP